MSPFDPPAGWRELSPLGRVPVLRDTDVGTEGEEGTIADSSAVCGYLERRFPEPALYPSEPFAFGRALWLEEYGDTELAARIGFGIWRTMVVGPLNGEPPDPETARRTVHEKLPRSFAYLDATLAGHGGEWLLGEGFSLADIACATHLIGLLHAGSEVDGTRWPALAAWLARTIERPSLAGLVEEERETLGEHSRL